jgi:CRISPR-associated protein Cas6
VNPSIDIRWLIASLGSIPIHHQYPLLSAVSRIIPAVHASGEFGVHPIQGMRTTPGQLDLLPHSSLTIRTGVENIPTLLPLSGKKLELSGCPIRLGVPQVIELSACPVLKSPLVTIKGYTEGDLFKAALGRQLDALGISRSVNVEVGRRKILRIKQQIIVGFTVRVDHLDDSESLLIQAVGLGGRRHLGCGLFSHAKQGGTERGGE